MKAADSLSVTFLALSDPTRRAILKRLADGPASVGELASPFSLSLPAVSKHLKVLERAGLVGRERQAQWRPCHLQPEKLRDAAAWIDRYRRFWDEGFDKLEHYLDEIKKRKDPDDGTN